MEHLLTAAESRAYDEMLINEHGADSRELMKNAAHGVADVILARGDRGVAVFCGRGNNGGDGLALAAILHERGRSAAVYIIGGGKLSPDAEHYRAVCAEVGCAAVVCESAAEIDAVFAANGFDVCVDALLGTGLSRDIDGLYFNAIERINAFEGCVVAVDIPSGLDSDTGAVRGVAVNADITVAFHTKKIGHYLYNGRACSGAVTVKPISDIADSQAPRCVVWGRGDAEAVLPKKKPGANKGDFGRALVFAGSRGMGGAALMCAASALKSGCGLVTAACPASAAPYFARIPEVMTLPYFDDAWECFSDEPVSKKTEAADALAFGPGIGSAAGIPRMIRALLETRKPLVLDADALNAISGDPGLKPMLHERVVLTPHIGEMARLTGLTKDAILADQLGVAKKCACEWNCVVLLKSAVSVVAAPDGRSVVNVTGNNALARGGSGDVLTGITVSLLAQGCSPFDAASLASYVLGLSADDAVALLSTRLVSATDVIDIIEYTLNKSI